MFQGDVSFPLHYAASGYALSILINNATCEYFQIFRSDFFTKKIIKTPILTIKTNFNDKNTKSIFMFIR